MLSSLSPPGFASAWWKDLCLLGSVLGIGGDWFEDTVARKMGNGTSTRFWHDSWIGLHPMRLVFPRPFLISVRQEGSVADFGSWVDGVWVCGTFCGDKACLYGKRVSSGTSAS